MRILLLANSYPTVAAPSGAPYMTARLRELTPHTAARPDVSVCALALRPVYSPPARALRAGMRAASQASLGLAPQHTGPGQWQEAPVQWNVADLVAVRRGRRPEAAIAHATQAVLTAVGTHTFDIVHAHGMYAMPAGEVGARVAHALRLPYAVTMHGSDVTEAMAATPAQAAATLAAAGATMYVSEALRTRAWELGAPQPHSHVIPNGVDTHLFSPGDSEQSGESRQSGESDRPAHEGGPRLLFVGNLLSVKGADRLPAVVERVARTHPGVRLTVAGDGPHRAAIAERLGERAVMLGRVDQAEVARQMRAADVLLVPSRSEGWGCVVSESYAVGTPVVASDVGGLRESVLDPAALVPAADEAAGGLPPQEAEARFAADFATRVCGVLAQPPAPAAMRAHVAGQSWSEVVARELAVLRDVLEAAR